MKTYKIENQTGSATGEIFKKTETKTYMNEDGSTWQESIDRLFFRTATDPHLYLRSVLAADGKRYRVINLPEMQPTCWLTEVQELGA